MNIISFLRILSDSVNFAIQALRVNLMRTMLSVLGITIGIFSIISVFAIVDSMERYVRNSINSLGNDVIYVQKWPWIFDGPYPWWKYINMPNPNYRESQIIQDKSRFAQAVAYVLNVPPSTFKYKDFTASSTPVTGVTHEWLKFSTSEVEKGRYFTHNESNAGHPVAIIGYTIKEGLFPNSDPENKVITMNGRPLRVIGYFKKQGESLVDQSTDHLVIVPVNYLRGFLSINSGNYNPSIMVKARDGVAVQRLEEELKIIMRGQRRLGPREENNFALNKSTMLSSGIDQTFKVLNMAGWIIGCFSLLVGGFGIANIMFVSVKERTNQIGIQKSLGAKNIFILLQFLTESVALCIMGGLLGLILVAAGTTLISVAFDINLYLQFDRVILALAVSTLIGIISGFIPAMTASRLDPVEAIRQ